MDRILKVLSKNVVGKKFKFFYTGFFNQTDLQTIKCLNTFARP